MAKYKVEYIGPTSRLNMVYCGPDSWQIAAIHNGEEMSLGKAKKIRDYMKEKHGVVTRVVLA